jgi:hypothetical protein
MAEKNKPKPLNENGRQKLMAGLYLVPLIIISTTLISLFSSSQSAQSIVILFAMSLTFVLSVVLLVIRQQPVSSSVGQTSKEIIVAVSVSLVANVIWYLLFYFLSGSTAPT